MRSKPGKISLIVLLFLAQWAYVRADEILTVISSVTFNYSNASNNDYGRDVAIDNQGNIIIAGYTDVSSVYFLTAKYNSDFTALISSHTINGDSAYDDYAYGVAVDQSDHIYVTGTADSNDQSFYTIEYDTGLAVDNAVSFDPNSRVQDAADIVVDNSGNVIVTGVNNSAVEGLNYDYCTVKYNSSLVLQSSVTYDGQATGEDYSNAVTVDTSGNIIVTGYTTDGLGNKNCHTIKYDSSLNELYFHTLTNTTDDVGTGVGVDSSGNIYVAGHRSDGSKRSYFILKYPSNLTSVTASVSFDVASGTDNYVNAATVEDDGTVTLVGHRDNGSDTDWCMVRYDNTLQTVLSSAAYAAPAGGDDSAYGVAVDSCYIVMAGHITSSDKDIFAIKYKYTRTSESEPEPDDDPAEDDPEVSVTPKEIKIVGSTEGKGTINPDKGDTAEIYFKGASTGKYTLRIFTQLGELVYEESKESLPDGKFSWIPKDLASGIYIAHVKGPGVDIHKKIAILR